MADLWSNEKQAGGFGRFIFLIQQAVGFLLFPVKQSSLTRVKLLLNPVAKMGGVVLW